MLLRVTFFWLLTLGVGRNVGVDSGEARSERRKVLLRLLDSDSSGRGVVRLGSTGASPLPVRLLSCCRVVTCRVNSRLTDVPCTAGHYFKITEGLQRGEERDLLLVIARTYKLRTWLPLVLGTMALLQCGWSRLRPARSFS